MITKYYDTYLKCRECNSQCESDSHLLIHIKKHDSTAKYFEKHFPKYDLYSGEQIKFKSLDQYLLTDFTDKRNLKSWLKTGSHSIAADYLKNKLKAYCQRKGLSIAPSQSELKTINCLPKIETFTYFCGQNFHQICESIGLKSNFIYRIPFVPSDFLTYSSADIVIDTREQRPLKFKNINVIKSKLECGDYAKSVDSKVVVERKSSSDFYSTLSSGRERFQREIKRAKEMGIYIVVNVESPLSTVMYAKRKFGACSGEYIMHYMRQLCRNFDNIQFVFSEGKAQAAQKTLFILEMDEKIRIIDLEYWFDQKEFSWL